MTGTPHEIPRSLDNDTSDDIVNSSSTPDTDSMGPMVVPFMREIYTAAMIAAFWTQNNPKADPAHIARMAIKQIRDYTEEGRMAQLYGYWKLFEQERQGLLDQRSAPARVVPE